MPTLVRTVRIIKNEAKKGYIALLSVIMISAIGAAIMISVISSGISASKTDFSLQQLGGARSMASSCAEEALQKILETGTTSSSGVLTIVSGNCSYVISSQNGQNIMINSTGFLGTVTSKVQVIVATTSPGLTLSSWSEVVDF